ncbi:unnamed protein product [Prorocentrum cordatum]|uniref:Hsp70-interacting protein N-terminal domain-containing protein n=1 Tax=Prorocentrum cordatum TaxID=2364126 RepID=A0ABN9SCD1_9DINO|nr:unnamed protein product [Polarella glacialis]
MLQKSFADTLISMLNNIKCFGPAEATQLVDALRGEPHGADHTERIMFIIGAKVAKSSGSIKPEGSNNKQLLKEWWSYLTKSDWEVINDPKISLNRKMTTMVEYSLFELPPDIFQAAYPGDDQPSKIELKGINAVGDKISLRSTRGALVPSPNDPYEMGLFYECQQKLLDHRKKRKAKAQEDTKAKTLAKKGAADAAKEATTLEVKADAPPRKRPAAAAAAVKHVKAAKVELAAAAKGGGKSKDADLKPIPKSKIMGAMPSLPKDGSNPPPVAYKQGVIYTSVKVRRFRAFRYLERMSLTLPNGEFVLLQQAFGLTFAKRGLLLDRALDRLVNPTEVFMHDYMHALFVDGVVNLVIYLTFEAFISAGLNGVWESFSEFLATWAFPGLHARLPSAASLSRTCGPASPQMSEKVEELGALQLMALETFVENMEADPSIIHKPDLQFFKDFLIKIGATLPTKPFGDAAAEEEDEEDGEEDVPDEADPLRLPDDKPPFPPVIPSEQVELTDDQMDAQHAAKEAAMEALDANDLEKALEKYVEYMKFGNPTAMIYAKRAEILLKLKRPNACIADCTAAIEINPDSGKAYRIRGRAHRGLCNWEQAHKDLALGQQLDYDDDAAEIQKIVDAKWQRIQKKRKRQEKAGAAKRQKEASVPEAAPPAAANINAD